MRPKLLLISIAIFPFFAGSQDLVTADRYYESGDSSRIAEDYRSGLEYLSKASESYSANDEVLKLAMTLARISDCQWNLGMFEDSWESSQKGLELISDQNSSIMQLVKSLLYDNLAIINLYSGQFQEAFHFSRKAVAIKEALNNPESNLQRSYNIVGTLHGYFKAYDSAIYYQKRGLEYLKTLESSTPLELSKLMNGLATIYFSRGSLTEAQEILVETESLLNTPTDRGGGMHQNVLNNLGAVYAELGAYNLALDYQLKSISLQQDSDDRALYDRALSYENIGINYWAQGDFAKTEEYLLKGLSLREQIEGHQSSLPYITVGRIYAERADRENALIYLQKGRKILQESGEQNQIDLQLSHLNLGISFGSIGEIEKADYHFRQAVESINSFDRAAFGTYEEYVEFLILSNQIDKADSLNQIFLEINAIDKNATYRNVREELDNQTHALNYFNGQILQIHINSKKNWLPTNSDLTTELYEMARSVDSLGRYMRNDLIRLEDKSTLGVLLSDIISLEIAFAFILGKNSDPRFFQDLFQISESSRYALLQLRQNDFWARQMDGVSEKLLDQEKQLKEDYSYQYSRLQQAKIALDTMSITYWQEQIFNTRAEQDTLIKTLELNSPKYHQLKYQQPTMTVSDIQQKLDSDQALIEYFEADTALYLMVITKDQFQVDAITKDKNFSSDMSQFRGNFNAQALENEQEKRFKTFMNASYNLYTTLLKPALSKIDKNVSKLVIVPDQQMSLIPWDLMVTDTLGTDQMDYKGLRYVIQDYEISYAPSATLLYGAKYDNDSRNSNGVLGFAPSYNSEDSTMLAESNEIKSYLRKALAPLKWNSEEVSSIREQSDGTYFVAESATERKFKEEAGNHQILHLSMHALVDHKDPMLSKLIFTQNSDSIEDGMLHTYELFNMDLSAEMVVLSACETGLGEVVKGEGVMSLGQAFAYAGCPSIVMSHWSVDDQSTAELMTHFYRFLENGENKASALRMAKLEFLKNAIGPKAHPFYWGGFVVFGDTDPIELKVDQSKFLIPALLLVVILVLFFRQKIIRRT